MTIYVLLDDCIINDIANNHCSISTTRYFFIFFLLNLMLTANSLAYCQGAQRDAWLPLLLPDAISYGRLINITKNFTFQKKNDVRTHSHSLLPQFKNAVCLIRVASTLLRKSHVV